MRINNKSVGLVEIQAHERSVKNVRVAFVLGVKAQLADFAATAVLAAAHKKLDPALVEEVTGEDDPSLEVSMWVVSNAHVVNLQISCTAQKGKHKMVVRSPSCLFCGWKIRAVDSTYAWAVLFPSVLVLETINYSLRAMFLTSRSAEHFPAQ